MISKTFSDNYPKDSAIQMKEVIHEPNYLEKLIKQNWDTFQMMSVLMEQFAQMAAHTLKIFCDKTAK